MSVTASLIILALILALIFAFADRFAGGGFGWPKLGFRGRPLWYAAPVAGLLTTLVAGWQVGLIAALSFMIWRGPGWKLGDRGGLAPQTVTDTAFLALRHALAGVLLPMALMAGLDAYAALKGLLGFIVGATLLGAAYGASVRRGRDIGASTEIIRGAAFGGLVWTLL